MTVPCETPAQADNICLDQAQTLSQLLKLLPRGRAWRTDIDTPVRLSFWNAIAAVYAYIEQRICALALEFFCLTESETNDIWMAQYGLPDECDPYPNLCAKVAAFGGTRCDYYAAIAAAAGWAIACVETSGVCGARAGCALAGTARAGGGIEVNVLAIIVYTESSPAYAAQGQLVGPLAGRLLAGQPLSCGPSIGPLDCILQRVVHAHVQISYQIA